MRPATAFAFVAALGGLYGCAPRAVLRVPPGEPVEIAPLSSWLESYNAGPPAVRAQGRLRASGKGTAAFGARVAEGKGFRLDAVAGPFSSPVAAVACRVGVECQVYVPSRNKLYQGRDEGWSEFLETLLRGRVPKLGEPSGAWALPDGGTVLALAGPSGWRGEVVFDPRTRLPGRVVVSRADEPVAEILYEEHFSAGGWAFPKRITIRVREPASEYEIEYRRVELDPRVAEDIFALSLPPGIEVETVTGSAQWNETGIPLWLPIPDG